MRALLLCLSAGGLLAGGAAHGAIYVQRDPGSGAVLYSNVPPAAGKARSHVAVFAPPVLAPAASQFPRITRAEQQQRDLGRQAILNDELAQERQRLQQAQAAGADAQAQQRHRSNIEALQRELAALH